MEAFNAETTAELDKIFASAETDLDKLIQGFDWITQRVIETTRHEIELARAMQDREAVVKHQIKLETLKSARAIFEGCYLRVTGKRTRLWKA